MRKFTLALCAFFLLIKFSWAQLVVNEVSQGTLEKEYVELLVIGTPNCSNETVDLRGWIVDDNNGTFKPNTGSGIAPGCIRFTTNSIWQNIKIGTLIVIYNEADRNSAIPANDIVTNDNDCLLIIPGNDTDLIERHTSLPDDNTTNYPTSGFGTLLGWIVNGMKNGGDAIQTRKPGSLNVPHHAVSWDDNNLNTIIYFSEDAGGKVFAMQNINSNDIFDQNNWVSLPTSLTSNQTPGAPNNTANANWINSLTNNCSSFSGGLNSVSISNNPATVCAGQNVTLSAITTPSASSAATYTWKQNGVTTGTNASTLTVNATTSPITYSVTVADACGSPVTTFTTIVGGVGGDASFTPASQTYCETDAIVNLVPTNTGGTFTISPATAALDATAKTFNPALADKNVFYTIKYTTAGSCGDEKSNIFSVSSGQTAKISIDKPAPYCLGETITLSSSSVLGNTWSTGETSQSIQVKTSGTYSLTVSGCAGATTTDFATIQFSSVTADFEPSITEGNVPLDVTFTDKSENAVSYVWNFGDDSNLSDLKNPVHTYVKEGEYEITLIVKNPENCVDTASYTFIKISSTIFIQIPNVFSPNNDGPNDLFKLKTSGVKSLSCKIYNRWGKQVAKFEDANGFWDGGNYADGVYFYLINVTFIDNSTKEYNGNVTLLR
ncbi:MAG: gliding motility-associated C-terminal domain-containing protein [Bacteroidota bacterium]